MPINTWYQFPRAKAGGYWLSLMFQYSPVKELRLNLRPSEAASSINNMREKINPNNLTKGVMAVGAFGLLTAYKIGHRVLYNENEVIEALASGQVTRYQHESTRQYIFKKL